MTTHYEIAASKNGKQTTVAFTARKTKQCLINNVRHYGFQISLSLGSDLEAVCVKANKDEVVMSDGTRIFYTGRTELDAARAA